VDGYLLLDRGAFPAAFAADLPADTARFLADSQLPWGLEAVGRAISDPAWRAKPSWYLVAGQDRMIPPIAQHSMAERAGASVTEVAASHAVYVSQPDAVVSTPAS
jgi:pimeloyl-ACP methyl ester carboxylesterase